MTKLKTHCLRGHAYSGENVRWRPTGARECLACQKERSETNLNHYHERKCWRGMIARCHDETNRDYASYGGRGIKVCERWRESFDAFLADMGERPSGLTIERIENNKGYEISNCKWATDAEQNINKRSVRRLTFKGITKPMCQWADDLGIKRHTLYWRIARRHWSTEKALTYGR